MPVGIGGGYKRFVIRKPLGQIPIRHAEHVGKLLYGAVACLVNIGQSYYKEVIVLTSLEDL